MALLKADIMINEELHIKLDTNKKGGHLRRGKSCLIFVRKMTSMRAGFTT
jgi:hypothetical protein